MKETAFHRARHLAEAPERNQARCNFFLQVEVDKHPISGLQDPINDVVCPAHCDFFDDE